MKLKTYKWLYEHAQWFPVMFRIIINLEDRDSKSLHLVSVKELGEYFPEITKE